MNIMWIALITFLVGSTYMNLTWYRCVQLEITFPLKAKMLSIFGTIGFLISILFFFDVERVFLHSLFSVMGIIYSITIFYPKGKYNDKKTEVS